MLKNRLFSKVFFNFPIKTKFNVSIQDRLFISSVILIFVTIVTLFISSNFLTLSFIIQKQSDYELKSFKQVNDFFRTIFTSTEGNIETLYRISSFKTLLTENFDKESSLNTVNSLSKFENSINTVLINKDFMDKIIVLGKNNFAAVYTQKDIFFDTAFIGEDFNFLWFLEKSIINQFQSENNHPFYFSTPSNYVSTNKSEENVIKTINKKLIMIRQLKDKNGQIDGIIVVVFKNNIVANIIPKSQDERSIYLTTKQGNVIWYNNPILHLSMDNNPILTSYLPSDQISYNGVKYLTAHNTLEPYELIITSLIPEYSFLKIDRNIKLFTLIFGFCCIIIAFISSYILSRNTCKQLESLAQQLKNTNGELPEKVSIDQKGGKFQKSSMKTKIYLHYGISVVVPSILFIILITFSNYNMYKDKIIQLEKSSSMQLKWNIDNKISNYDKLTFLTIFNSDVQNFFNPNLPNAVHKEYRLRISEAFLSSIIKNKDVMSIDFFNLKGDLIYSTIPFNSLSTTNISPDFLSIMETSSDRLIYICSKNDYLGIGPVIQFARKVRDSYQNFGNGMGYMLISINQEAIADIIKNDISANSGFFFIEDSNGNIISETAKSQYILSLHDKIAPIGFVNKSSFDSIELNQKQYIIFNNPLEINSLNIKGIIPVAEIMKKVYPTIWLNLIIFIIHLLLIAMIVSLISYSITKPLRKMEKLMKEIQDGNFNVYMDYTGKDEIALLSYSFNNMVDKLNHLIFENYQSKVKQSELLFLEKEAQLNALQQQINPHFLYNTLESIKWMAYKINAIEICNMATALGSFFRGAITNGKGLITIQQEIEHLENYIYIQKIRYKGKLTVICDIHDEIRQCKTIKLILQPLVENAVIHSIEKMRNGGIITLRGFKSGDCICFEIIDNGKGMDQKTLSSLLGIISNIIPKSEKSSIGLDNVYKRLKLYFEDKSNFEIFSDENTGTTVRITFPVIF